MSIKEWFKGLPAERKALMLFVVLALVALIAAWYDKSPTEKPSQMLQAPPIAGTNVPKQDIPLKSIKILPKKVVARKVPLPAEVADDSNVEVTETAEVEPSENGTKVISTINTTTGETRIYTKENDPSLFAFQNKRRIGVGYGIGTGGSTAKLFGEWTFLRVGSFHAGMQGDVEITTTKGSEAKVTAVVDYRW